MKSLRSRLTLRLLVGGTLLLGGAGTILFWQVERALTAEFDATLRATAQSLASLTEQKPGGISLELPAEDLRQFERPDDSDVFVLYGEHGREIARSASLGTTTVPPRLGRSEAPEYFYLPASGGRMLRCVALSFQPHAEEDDGEKVPAKKPPLGATLLVGRDPAPLVRTLAALRASLLAVGVGALAVLAVLVRREVRSGLAPLDRLAESVGDVEATSLATRFPIDPLPTELQPIAARLNELLARLESAFARERRFTATAAHEFRTPLAELRALAEVNLTTPSTDAERIESWRDALAATRRMESLALRLLDLARAEDSAHILRREPVSLSIALTTALQPSAARAAGRNITLETTLPSDLTIHTDRALLAVILGNLCANAIAHAPSGTPFRVTAQLSSDSVTLHFRNLATNLTTDDLPHLFERFWRKDPARSDHHHHGLGLALAAEFTTLLGGTLTADLSANGELDFALRLPIGRNGP